MYLLDTNHCSALIFGDSLIIDHAKSVGESNLAISVVTEGELLYMAENSQKIAENLQIIEDFIADISIYDINDRVSHIYAKLKAKIMDKFAPKEKNKRRKTKITNLGIGENDLWIAATAIENNLIVISRDSDFKKIQQAWDFSLENWHINE
jgi:tRNA(fMet)-specific endonuclease VapC